MEKQPQKEPVYETHPTLCKCGYTLDRLTEVDERSPRSPKTGDVTLCVKCAQPYIFDQELVPQPVTMAQVRKQLNPEDVRVVERIIEIILAK